MADEITFVESERFDLIYEPALKHYVLSWWKYDKEASDEAGELSLKRLEASIVEEVFAKRILEVYPNGVIWSDTFDLMLKEQFQR